MTIERELFRSRQFWVSVGAIFAGVAGLFGYEVGDVDEWIKNGSMIAAGIVGTVSLIHGVKGIRRPAERITSIAGVEVKPAPVVNPDKSK